MKVSLQSSVQLWVFGFQRARDCFAALRTKSFCGQKTRLLSWCDNSFTQVLKMQEQLPTDNPNKHARKAFVRPNRIFIRTRTNSDFIDRCLFPPDLFGVLVKRRL